MPDEAPEGAGGDEEGLDDERFEVWAQNERALGALLVCQRQWRVGPMGGVLGFDYCGVEAVLRMRKIPVDTALLDDLAVIEGAVMDVWSAKQSHQGGPR